MEELEKQTNSETEVQNNTETPVTATPRHHKRPQPIHDSLFKVRQVLNLLFIVLGVIGAVMYSGLLGRGTIETMGGIIAVIAISMKMAECVIRIKK